MTKEEILKMAREAGLSSPILLQMYGKEDALCDSEIASLRQIERFAALVAAAEREACAKVCEEPGWNAANWCAKAIRARGKS